MRRTYVMFMTISLILLETHSRYSHTEIYPNKCYCKPFSKNMTSIIVKNSMGNLGNKMFSYIQLYILKVKYGFDVYITENVAFHLNLLFENVSAFPLAERSLCGFKRFFKEFSADQWSRITNYYYEEADRRKSIKKSDNLFMEEESQEETSILHSDGMYNMKNNINSTLKSLSSFPWEEFSGNMKILENEKKVGKAYIFYPNGMQMKSYDDTFGEDINYNMDDVPGVVDFAVDSFQFRQEILDASKENLEFIAEHFRKENPKKFRKKTDITFVGIHNRRGDHLDYQKEGGFVMLDPGYFLNAMESFREKYRRVVFLYVSDDMEWGKQKIKRRLKTKDFYLAGSLIDPKYASVPKLAAAYDLSLLSLCNHTITSYGTYSFWAGFLAGQAKGVRIIPAFFPKYKTATQVSYHFQVDPFTSKLPRFYFGMKFLR